MPIEFACEECGSVLRVPDGTSGKRSRCPTCKHEQEIPWVVADGQQAVASEKLSIPCPKCQHHLVCSPDLLGTLGQCKKCQHIFTISTAPVSSDAATPALVFHCPECRQLFEGREEMRGRKGKCHVCQAVFAIELEPAQPKRDAANENLKPATKPQSRAADSTPAEKTATPKPATTKPSGPRTNNKSTPSQSAASPQSNDEDELLLIEEPEPKSRSRDRTPTPTPSPSSASARPVAKPKPKGPIRFQCSQCTGVMEVPGSTAGLETECPYCQTIQEIPSESMSVSTSSAMNVSSAAYSSAPTQPAFDPLGGLDLSISNPYAAPAQSWSAPAASSYSAPRSRSRQLSVGNVLQLGFESMFPSCLMYFVQMFIMMIATGIMYGLLLLVLFGLRGTGETGLYIAGVAALIFAIGVGLMSAWLVGAISRTALDAVRKKPFNFGNALNPEGAFNTAILVAGGGILIMLIAYLPIIVQATTGALKGMEALIVVWFMLFIPVMMIYGFATSLALFAGADGEASSEAMSSSFSLVFGNFGITLGVFLLSGLIAGVLALPTLGISYLLPIYTSAALYHLATRNR